MDHLIRKLDCEKLSVKCLWGKWTEDIYDSLSREWESVDTIQPGNDKRPTVGITFLSLNDVTSRSRSGKTITCSAEIDPTKISKAIKLARYMTNTFDLPIVAIAAAAKCYPGLPLEFDIQRAAYAARVKAEGCIVFDTTPLLEQ